jgi:hypothetical protein
MKNSTGKILVNIDDIPKMSLRILLFLVILVFMPYVLIHGSNVGQEISYLSSLLDDSFFSFLFRMVLPPTLFILVSIFGIVIHEAIHALFFSFFLPSKLKGILFGFNKDHGIPFVYIKEPISVLGYRVGAVMPLIILGIIPAALGLYSGYLSLTAFGALFTVSASGDLLLIARTKGLPVTQKIKDLPDKIGFELV